MLCALLDSIEGLVREVRCADLTTDQAARAWFERRSLELHGSGDPSSHDYDFVIADAQDQSWMQQAQSAEALALIRVPAANSAQDPGAPWSRVAHVVSGKVHWQLWRRSES